MNPPLKKRILLLLAVCLIQAIYTPTSLFMKGGIEPKLPWDVFPLQVGWVIPYILCYPLWAFTLGWLIWKTDERRFRQGIAALFFTCSVGVTTFLLLPTYVVLPELSDADFLTNILRSIQISGGTHDALPSAHIYVTSVLALLFGEWYPKQKWLWMLIVLIVSLSTLYTKQHYILDVIGGYVTAWLGFSFGLWWNIRAARRTLSAQI